MPLVRTRDREFWIYSRCGYIYKIFKYIDALKSTQVLPSSLEYHSSTATSDADKAELFNTFFHSVFTISQFNTTYQTLTSSPPPRIKHYISDITISPNEVYEELTQLNPAKAAGTDNLSPKTLKYCAHALYIPIHHLFSECISQCNIPAEWRIHRVTPVHKSGAKDQANNYRPISLLYMHCLQNFGTSYLQ